MPRRTRYEEMVIAAPTLMKEYEARALRACGDDFDPLLCWQYNLYFTRKRTVAYSVWVAQHRRAYRKLYGCIESINKEVDFAIFMLDRVVAEIPHMQKYREVTCMLTLITSGKVEREETLHIFKVSSGSTLRTIRPNDVYFYFGSPYTGKQISHDTKSTIGKVIVASCSSIRKVIKATALGKKITNDRTKHRFHLRIVETKRYSDGLCLYNRD